LANLSKSISNPVESPAGVQIVDTKLPEMVMNHMFITVVVMLLEKKVSAWLKKGCPSSQKYRVCPITNFY
jgi:hypothetical protein